jgi:hypothetical protein
MLEERSWLFAEKDEGSSNEENVARYGALFPESVAQVSPRRFLPRADSSGALSHA